MTAPPAVALALSLCALRSRGWVARVCHTHLSKPATCACVCQESGTWVYECQGRALSILTNPAAGGGSWEKHNCTNGRQAQGRRQNKVSSPTSLGALPVGGPSAGSWQAPRACPHPLATTFSPASLRHLVRHHSPWVVYTLRAKKPVYGSSKYELHKTRAVQQTVRFAIAILAGP